MTGMSPEKIEGLTKLASSTTRTVTYKDGKYTMKLSAGQGKEVENTFENGKEFDFKRLFGDTLKATVTVEKDKWTIVAKGNYEMTVNTECDDAGCKTHMSIKGIKETGEWKWKRV